MTAREPEFISGDSVRLVFSTRTGTIADGEYSISQKTWKYRINWSDGRTSDSILEKQLVRWGDDESGGK